MPLQEKTAANARPSSNYVSECAIRAAHFQELYPGEVLIKRQHAFADILSVNRDARSKPSTCKMASLRTRCCNAFQWTAVINI